MKKRSVCGTAFSLLCSALCLALLCACKSPKGPNDIENAVDDQSVVIRFETFGGEKIDDAVYQKGEKVTIDFKASKFKGTFDGWYTDNGFENEAPDSFVAEKSVTLYAKFMMDTVTVRYVMGDETTSVTMDYGSKIKLPEFKPVRLGYSFTGWADEAGAIYDENSTVTADDLSLYPCFDYDFKEIPAIVIETENQTPVTSKETYIRATVSVLNTTGKWELCDVSAGIRGRGNSSWTDPSGKQPYRIKFDKKQSMFGSSYKAKSWTLIANAADKSLLRNYIAYELGSRMDGIAFSSAHVPVDVYLNGTYRGVYLLCDQIQTGSGRVEIDESVAADGNNGYLIERDERAVGEGVLNQDYFYFQNQTYTIKTPDTEAALYLENKATQIGYIVDYMTRCFSAIRSGTWEEVEALIDIDSFIDSYIVDELFANVDCGYASCYYYKDKDGKLFKGPLWDYDLGAGNENYSMGNERECRYDAKLYAVQQNTWYKELCKRDEFKKAVAEKLKAYQGLISDVIGLLDTDSADGLYGRYKEALNRNFKRWKNMGLYVWPEPRSVYRLITVKQQVDYVRDWLENRYLYVCRMYGGI